MFGCRGGGRHIPRCNIRYISLLRELVVSHDEDDEPRYVFLY